VRWETPVLLTSRGKSWAGPKNGRQAPGHKKSKHTPGLRQNCFSGGNKAAKKKGQGPKFEKKKQAKSVYNGPQNLKDYEILTGGIQERKLFGTKKREKRTAGQGRGKRKKKKTNSREDGGPHETKKVGGPKPGVTSLKKKNNG